MVFAGDLRNIAGGNAADVAIVGAGAVGLLLATDLARAGKRVILVEAGQSAPDAADYRFQNIASVGRPHHGLELGRFRAIGGTTTQWGGQLVPIEPIAFEPRNWLGETGWPIQATDLTAAHETVLDRLGMGARLSEDAVWRRLKVSPPATGDEIELFLTRWAPEPNFARLFSHDLGNNPALIAVTGAAVTSLFKQADGARYGLTVQSTTGTAEICAEHVVLANGTMEIARLLMAPLTDGRAAPWAGNRWLGRGFVDHLDVYAGTVGLRDAKRFHATFDAAVLKGIKYLPKLKLTASNQRRHERFGIAAHFVSASRQAAQMEALKTMARNLLNRTGFDYHFNRAETVQLLGNAWRTGQRYLLHRRIYNPTDGGIELRLSSEQKILPESALKLTAKSDAKGMRLAQLDWRIDGVEIATMADFAEHVGAFLEQSGLAELTIDPLLATRDQAFLDKVDDGYHHMGMARMAADAEDGVVDKNLRVFGTDNLYVAGAAVFRSTGFANPTLTALALAIRLSEAIQAGTLARR